MQKNQDLPNGFSMQEAMRLAKSREGRQLMELLQSAHSQSLQSAMAQAQAGNYDEIKKTLASVMDDPQARNLLQQLGGQKNG